jgi:hypothetical protein
MVCGTVANCRQENVCNSQWVEISFRMHLVHDMFKSQYSYQQKVIDLCRLLWDQNIGVFVRYYFVLHYTCFYHSRMLLTPWSTIILKKLTVTQLVKKFPTFYGMKRFITVFTRAHHWSLFWARWIQSTPSHPVSLRSSESDL